MQAKKYLLAVALVLVTFSATAFPTIFNVPADHPTIQAAINAAYPGDTVVVAPGTYHENINFQGKTITVTSANPADPNIVAETIIDAGGVGSTVLFANYETRSAVLTGFTITGGQGTSNTTFDAMDYWGGGIYCYLSSPTIIRNVIVGNNVADPASSGDGWGGGIACFRASPLVTFNTIWSNSAYTGGALFTYMGTALTQGNLIYANRAEVGGGVVMAYGGRLLNNTIAGNEAYYGGNVYAVSDTTSGLSVVSSNIICDAIGGGGFLLNYDVDVANTRYNNLWNNAEGDYPGNVSADGVNGNISRAPGFVAAELRDYRLRFDSHCVNAGNPGATPAAGQTDFYGNPRMYAGRIDIGACEYYDNYRPVAVTGPDQSRGVTGLPATFVLDGSASWDPNGDALTYHWRQLSGSQATFNDPDTVAPVVTVYSLGSYEFVLVPNDGLHDGLCDTVRIVVTDQPPVANAGDDQTFAARPASVTLDGTRSSDLEGGPLSYHWRQISGWKVALSDPNAACPTFTPIASGTYVFELVVNDSMVSSAPDTVGIVAGNNHAPVANAGTSRYVGMGAPVLNGAGSYDPDGYGALTYQWRQISGPAATITGANTATPTVSGFTRTTVVRKCTFELVVSDGLLSSPPSTVDVFVVINFGNSNNVVLTNPPFDPAKPTILAFGGGNCRTGSGMEFGSPWSDQANWFTVNSYSEPYSRYAEMLLVYLSRTFPDYDRPIQTMGYSTGNKPAMEVARYLNVTYREPRFCVNRVSLLDAVCNNLSTSVAQFHANPIGGEQCWVDNYITNDPSFNRAAVITGALNIVCDPYRSHGYPVNRYAYNSGFDYDNSGIGGFAYLSVIGAGSNYQLSTSSNKYYFQINSAEQMMFYNQSVYPGKILQPVVLAGPDSGTTIDPNGAVLTSLPCENAVGYQLLFGSGPSRVMDYSIISDTPEPPTALITHLPFNGTWWTIRAYDQFGSTIYADPMLIRLPANSPPIADTGSDITVRVPVGGRATVTLGSLASHDPDGDTLTSRWAWVADDGVHEANSLTLTLDLPIGLHTVQLMVSDGLCNSQPDEVVISVVENVPPIANAGADQVLYADHTGRVTAVLDGSASSDPEGQPITFLWSGTVDGRPVSSTQARPSLELPVGTHTFTLVVSDALDAGNPDTCTVTVVAARDMYLLFKPRFINVQARTNSITAIMIIRGVTRAEIDPSAPITMWPFGTAASYKFIFGGAQQGPSVVVIMAIFDVKPILDACDRTSWVWPTIETKLRSGQYVTGRDFILVWYPPRRGYH